VVLSVSMAVSLLCLRRGEGNGEVEDEVLAFIMTSDEKRPTSNVGRPNTGSVWTA
jgi:hypothetical protein